MRYVLLAVALLVSPFTLDAQKPEKAAKGRADVPKAAHSDFSFSVGEYPTDTLELDLETIYVSKSGALVHVESGEAFSITDADGTDGEAGVTMPAGHYDVYARATGKAGRTVTLNDQIFTVAKKRKLFEPVMVELTFGAWTYTGDADLQLRFYQAAPVPTADTTVTDSAQ